MTEETSASFKWPEPLIEDFQDPEWPNFELEDGEILKWVMKHKRLLLRTVTWNLCAKPPPAKEELQKTLLVKKFHVYIFGTEECERSIAQSAINPSKKNWETYLTECFGATYIPIRSHTLQAIHVMAFVHKAIAPLCTFATSAAVATGVGNTLGNKGGVGIFLKIGNTKILVVNAHLTAHQNAVRQRNNDFFKINRALPLLLEKKENNSTPMASSGGMSPPPTTQWKKTAVENPPASSVVPRDSSQMESTIDQTDPPPFIAPPESLSEPPLATTTTSVSKAAESNVISTTPAPAPAPKEVEKDSDSEDDEEMEEDISPRYSKSTMPSESLSDLTGLAPYGDVVIFMGDLNYRIKGNRPIINQLLERNMHEVLLHNDQLRTSMAAKEVFQNFTEPPLHFKPTYKYDIGTNIYDSSPKQRIPSWTDRILYVPSERVQCIAYNADTAILTSDHKPVYASFMISLELFVHLDENQNAILPTDLSPKFTSESQVCTIM